MIVLSLFDRKMVKALYQTYMKFNTNTENATSIRLLTVIVQSLERKKNF
jgi:hypothetical protein